MHESLGYISYSNLHMEAYIYNFLFTEQETGKEEDGIECVSISNVLFVCHFINIYYNFLN
jgi:hypothetical protein